MLFPSDPISGCRVTKSTGAARAIVPHLENSTVQENRRRANGRIELAGCPGCKYRISWMFCPCNAICRSGVAKLHHAYALIPHPVGATVLQYGWYGQSPSSFPRLSCTQYGITRVLRPCDSVCGGGVTNGVNVTIVGSYVPHLVHSAVNDYTTKLSPSFIPRPRRPVRKNRIAGVFRPGCLRVEGCRDQAEQDHEGREKRPHPPAPSPAGRGGARRAITSRVRMGFLLPLPLRGRGPGG